jgi:hypothetical protein
MSPMLFLAAAICAAGDPAATPVAFQFRDAVKYESRPVLQYRAIEFRQEPVRPLGDRKFAPGALYGVVPVGPAQEAALTIVWLPKAAGGAELWLDANGDGRLADDERHLMSGRELAIPAAITIQLKPERKQVKRTLLFRRSTLGDGLRYTVRGYMQGQVKLGGKSYATLLVDGNANGCFDTIGQDRVWIDLDQDGRFDPLTEQFPLGKPIVHHGETYVIRSDAAASAVMANLRSAGQGKVRLRLAKKPAAATTISAELVSDLGELVCVDKLDAATSVPFGEHRLSSLQLTVPDSCGQKWTYNFNSDRARSYSVPTGKETTITLLRHIRMDVSLTRDRGKVTPGQTIDIQPRLTADRSLYLSSCTTGKDADCRQPEGNAEIVLLGPGGKVVNRGMSGFS